MFVALIVDDVKHMKFISTFLVGSLMFFGGFWEFLDGDFVS